jgi:hypothetical protein
MTSTIKAQIIHKQIMLIISSEMVQKAGEMNEGWSKESHNHIQHTVDVIENKRRLLQRQIENTSLENEKQEELIKFKTMLEKDLKLLLANVNSDGVPEEMHDVVLNYAEQIKDTIGLLKAAID